MHDQPVRGRGRGSVETLGGVFSSGSVPSNDSINQVPGTGACMTLTKLVEGSCSLFFPPSSPFIPDSNDTNASTY